MSVTGFPGGKPVRTGIAVGDLTAGNLLALRIMMALYQRERTGRGRWVHTSLIESLLFMMDFQATRGSSTKRSFLASATSIRRVPTEVFETVDGYIALAAPSSRMWPWLCAALGHPEWEHDPDWSTGEGRSAHRAELHAEIGKLIATNSTVFWIDTLNEAGVTCGPIYTVDQAFEDRQVGQLGMAAQVEHPALGLMYLVASPLNLPDRHAESVGPR